MDSALINMMMMGGATSFSPADIAGLYQWLDASDLTTITEAAGAVSQWDDKSGNGYHATQAIASEQPLTSSSTINSLNVILFDGIDDSLTLNSAIHTVPAGNNTLFVVYKTNDAAKTQRLLNGTVGGGTRWGSYITSTVKRAVNNSSFVPVDLSAATDLSQHVSWMKRDAANLTSGYGGSTATAADATNVTPDKVVLGSYAPAVSDFLDGSIGEVLVYNVALSNSDINQIGSYLNAKWSTPWVDI